MAEEGKGVALAILGIVAVIAVVGLIMLFTGATGKYATGGPGDPKVYTRQSAEGYAGGAANVENPYYDYVYETYGGISEGRYATGKGSDGFSSAGGAWDPSNVYGETPFDAASQPGAYAGPDIYGTTQAPTSKRSPASIPSGQNDACGGCPYGSHCDLDTRGWPSGADGVPGYPGCFVISGPTV